MEKLSDTNVVVTTIDEDHVRSMREWLSKYGTVTVSFFDTVFPNLKSDIQITRKIMFIVDINDINGISQLVADCKDIATIEPITITEKDVYALLTRDGKTSPLYLKTPSGIPEYWRRQIKYHHPEMRDVWLNDIQGKVNLPKPVTSNTLTITPKVTLRKPQFIETISEWEDQLNSKFGLPAGFSDKQIQVCNATWSLYLSYSCGNEVEVLVFTFKTVTTFNHMLIKIDSIPTMSN